MGIFGNKDEEKKDGSASEESEEKSEGKYPQPCSLCNKGPTDKHWGGQYFHKKCYRKLRKGAKGMI